MLHLYQEFSNLPDHACLDVRPCSDLLPFDKFKQYLDGGTHVAHLSDYIRVLALKKFGGWWVDSDAIVLRRLPSGDPYYFATLPAKRKGGGFYQHDRRPVESSLPGCCPLFWRLVAVCNTRAFAPACPSPAYWKDSPWMAGDDGKHAFCNTPIFVRDANDPWVLAVEKKVRRHMGKAKPWRINLNEWRRILLDQGLEQYVHPPITFCPLPFWWGFRDQPLKRCANAPPTTSHCHVHM